MAIDALAIRTVPAHERGSLNGAMQAGQIGGRVVFSSGVLYLAATTGERLAVPMLLSVLAITLLLVAFAPPVLANGRGPAPPGRRRRYLRLLLRTPRFWRLIAFASLSGAGFEAAGSLSGSWLVDRGFVDGDIATFRLVSAGLMALGALLGGRIADRHGAGRSARCWLVALAITIVGTGFTDSVVSYATMYFGIGGFTAASYALFMQNARGPLAATVFSAFMGLTNACEAWSGRVGGVLQVGNGYAVALSSLALVSLLAWPLVRVGGVPGRRPS